MPEQLPTARYCVVCGHALIERMVPTEGRRRLQCESCGHIHYVNPRVVTAIIIEHGGRVLLQQRAIEPGRGLWTFPGGFLEMGETPEEGAIRETKEEVGLDVDIASLHGVYARPNVGITLIVFRGTSESDAASVGDFESMAVEWFAPEAIPWPELAFETTERALLDWVGRRSEDDTV
jgi:mutator protein MutT